MDFLTWWFESHAILSTFLNPFSTILWCVFTEQAARGVLAGLWLLTAAFIKVLIERKG